MSVRVVPLLQRRCIEVVVLVRGYDQGCSGEKIEFAGIVA
jgi:hypothetical protein